ncbi:hypothetical protein QTP88_028749 [Uroleucon formosanum]
MYYFKLNENQLKKLREAHKNDTNATFQIASNKIFKGENIYYLDKIQLDKLKNAKEKKSGVRLEIRSSQIKDKKGGFLPLIFAGIGAASALVGSVTSIVNTVNDYKHKKAMEKETIRHNKEMENKDGSHWVAWKKIKNKKIYFDSFEMPPPPELVKYLGEDNLKYTDDKFQDYDDPPICGHLCLEFIDNYKKFI